MKSLVSILLFLALITCASAEIKTVVIPLSFYTPSDRVQESERSINTHLNKGWVVKAITVSKGSATVTVILESPAPVLLTEDIFYVRKLTPEEVARYKEGVKKEGK